MVKILILVLSAFSITYSQGLINATVSLSGNVFNQVTKLPETAVIKVFDTDGNRVNATRSNGAQNGAYFVSGLRPGQNYIVEITKKEFMIEKFNITVPNTGKYLEISQDFLIKPIKVGVQIPIAVTPFELRKSKLRFGSDIYLEDWVDVFNQNPGIVVKIVSYPDAKGNSDANKLLTSERAEAIKNYFVGKGITTNRISVSGSADVDSKNPPPTEKAAKGKRYIGPCYIEIVSTGN